MNVVLNFCAACGGSLCYGFRNAQSAMCPHCTSPVNKRKYYVQGTFDEQDARTLLVAAHEGKGGQLPSTLRARAPVLDGI